MPVGAVLDRLPNSEATIGGAVMTIIAAIAGAIAAAGSAKPGAAGLRAGLSGGVVLPLVGTTDAVAPWSGPRCRRTPVRAFGGTAAHDLRSLSVVEP